MKHLISLQALLVLSACAFLPLHAASLADLTYTTTAGKVTITDCDPAATGELIIPANIEGKLVTSIGYGAFSFCDDLTKITISNGVTSIGEATFRSCRSLTSITIPDSVTSIREGAFGGCTSLTSITIPDSVTSIGDYAFLDCNSLTSIKIPDSVTSIGYGAFFDCYTLTSMTIPDGVTSIRGYAFLSCTSLTSITIPDSVTSIESAAFDNCSSLMSITIPDSVTSIWSGAFSDCTSLITVTFLGDAPKIEDNAFKKSSPTLYREADAKGWTNTLAGRPVKLISDALNWLFDDSVTILDEAKKTIEMLNQRQELDAIDKRLRESAFRDDATVNLDDWGSPLLTNAWSQFSWSVKLVNSSNLTGSKERGYVSLTGKRENGNPFEVFFVQGNENQLVLDWDASIGWSEMSVGQMAKKLPQDEVFLRCRIGKKPGYDQSFGQDNYSGYVLTGELPDEFLFAYVNLDRPGGKLIDRNFRLLLNYGSFVSNDPPLQEQKVSLRLKFDNKIGAEGQFEIVEYLNDGWVNP